MRKTSPCMTHIFAGISVFLFCIPPISGQTANTGAIAGTVSDPSGALVPRAVVAIYSHGIREERDLTTDAEGSFSIDFLSPGSYDLTVRAEGFEPFLLNSVPVQITEVSRLKIQLALIGAKERIVVSAALSLLQIENATLGRVIDREAIENSPLVNRNFTEILGLTAGTNTDIVDATQLGAGSQEIRANGARSGDNNFMLNGVDANSYSSNLTEVTPFGGAGIAIPAPDTIQEFKVQTSLYDAQYGRGGGANVDVETRGHFGGADALVKETRLFLYFVSSHQGCECGILEQQCSIFEPSSDTAGPHTSLPWSCVRRPNRGTRRSGGGPRRFEYKSGSPQSSKREEPR